MLANHSTYLVGLMNLFCSNLSIFVLIFDIISSTNLLGVCFAGFLSGLIGSFNSTNYKDPKLASPRSIYSKRS